MTVVCERGEGPFGIIAPVLKNWRDSLSRTRNATFGRITTLLGRSEITEEVWDELEAELIQADLGVATATGVVEALRDKVDTEGITRSDDFRKALRDLLIAQLKPSTELNLAGGPSVILVVGVNGAGKTTSIAKLARYLQSRGRSVLLGAADTFRAAAVDQLQIWGERLGIEVVAGQPGGDPGAVVHDAAQAAASRHFDVLVVDTAGRLHTKFNLMKELEKVRKVAERQVPGAPHEVLLVLDASTGQNALSQAKAFQQATGVTGVILAKLDGSAKGGMAFAIQDELGLPIQFVGLGERVEDFRPFDREAFVDGLLA